jgi:c-di-GMP-related signal transduction protein
VATATAQTEDAQGRVCVARQPILDGNNQVFGYELLCRAAAQDTSWSGPLDQASARVFDDAILSLGLETLTAGRHAFLNLSKEVLLSDAAALLPAKNVVLELLETIPAEPDVLEACRSLKARGYAIALDDFEAGSPAEAFLPFAKYVKIDVLSTPAAAVPALAARFKKQGLHVVAEKVETTETLEMAKKSGCAYFQGYFFCRPQTFVGRAMSTRELTQMRLIAALNQKNVSLATVEDLLKQDPRLSYRVLRCVNSAAFGLRREIHSIREALLMLGLGQIRKWASIWSLAGMNGGSPELVTMTIMRARCCELLGASLDLPDNGAEYFLLGLCSLLDVILQRPMDAAVSELPLGAETRDALLGIDNPARHVLDAVIQYERGDWDEATQTAARVGLGEEEMPAAYHSALTWARQVSAAPAA